MGYRQVCPLYSTAESFRALDLHGVRACSAIRFFSSCCCLGPRGGRFGFGGAGLVLHQGASFRRQTGCFNLVPVSSTRSIHIQELIMSLVRNIAKVAVVTSIVMLYGCASINKAPASVDAESKQFKTNAAVSQVYVYRSETMGAAISMPVTVDGKTAGSTGPHSFFKFDLPAGTHTITSQGKESSLSVTTQAGKLYFVWQEVKMGAFSAGSKLQLVSEEQGKKEVAECTQIQSDF